MVSEVDNCCRSAADVRGLLPLFLGMSDVGEDVEEVLQLLLDDDSLVRRSDDDDGGGVDVVVGTVNNVTSDVGAAFLLACTALPAFFFLLPFLAVEVGVDDDDDDEESDSSLLPRSMADLELGSLSSSSMSAESCGCGVFDRKSSADEDRADEGSGTVSSRC